MGYQGNTRDLTKNNNAFNRSEDTFRVVGGVNFQPGSVIQLASQDLQVYPDVATAQLPGTGANQQNILGVVSDMWPGFGGAINPPSYVSPANSSLLRGTVGVDAVVCGYHPAVLIDQSGTGATTVSNQSPLIPSRATAGYAQGGSAVGGFGTVGVAVLPASGIGSSLTAAALAQASQTDTLTGTPAAGDTLSVTLQAPYTTTAPGVAQTLTFTTPPLTAGQAASVTTAAAALVAYLNLQPAFTKYFIASSSLGVVTITVNALANLFLVTFGSGSNLTGQFNISISGMVANSLTFAVSSTGGTISTAGGANFAGGTGYKGIVPALVA